MGGRHFFTSLATKDAETAHMAFLRSEDHSRTAPRMTHAKVPAVDDIDKEDDDTASHEEGSSDSSMKINPDNFIAQKRVQDEEASSSQLDPPNSAEEEDRREKRQKIRQDPAASTAAQPSSSTQAPAAPRPVPKAAVLLAAPRKVWAKPTGSLPQREMGADLTGAPQALRQ